jgi:hypothetical protein
MDILSSEDLQALEKASGLNRQIQDLQDQVDALSEPIAKKIMAILLSDDEDKARDLRASIDGFPDAFYRFELRTAYMARFPDKRIAP